MVFLDGYDGSEIFFRVTSRSRRGLDHVVWIRLDNGNVRCSCESAYYGRRTGNIYDDTEGCIHAQAVMRRLDRLMDGPKPTLQDYAATIDDRF